MTQSAGDVVLVVGGTWGVGFTAADLFSRQGSRVILTGRNRSRGEDGAAKLRDAGGDVEYMAIDVCDDASVRGVVETIVDKHGRLDVAFNNAGYDGPSVRLHEIDETEWSSMLDTKLSGAWRSMKAELAQMTRQEGGGRIVNMAGDWGLNGAPNQASYCAAAHGIMGLTQTAALEYARDNIRVNAVCPGAIRSPMLERLVPAAEDLIAYAQTTPMGRVAEQMEVAEAVVWLASKKSSFVNGVGLPLTGG